MFKIGDRVKTKRLWAIWEDKDCIGTVVGFGNYYILVKLDTKYDLGWGKLAYMLPKELTLIRE